MLWKLPDIRISADPLYPGAPAFLTNTFLLSIVAGAIVVAFFLIATRRPKIIPGRLQNLIEWIFQGLLNLCEEVAGKENGRRFFPIVASLFLFILISNWFSVVPGIDTIGLKTTGPGCEGAASAGIFLTGPYSNCITPLLRPPTTDLNFTIALSILTVVMTQVYGFRVLGWRVQISRYLTLKEGPIGLLVGILEFFLELLRVLSLSFRLFGNVFAGDVLLLVMSFIGVGLASIPFYFLELFVGFIQAFVFAFLTLLFFTLGTTAHGHDDAEEHHAAEAAHEAHEGATRALARE
ncbi:MAG TPA: F0F1 ATP synthase subunit A [Ktedonobacterales bacterium]